jgi:hypothetical protein
VSVSLGAMGARGGREERKVARPGGVGTSLYRGVSCSTVDCGLRTTWGNGLVGDMVSALWAGAWV